MILVTGASGLVGSHLILELARRGNKIKALAQQESSVVKALQTFKAYQASDEKLIAQIQWVYGDITDSEFIFEILNDVDYVYHCAALVSFSPADTERMNTINAKGTEVLVNMCLLQGVKKICHVSSVAALGISVNKQKVTEENYIVRHNQSTFYGISKYNAEREVWRASEEGLDMVIVNPSIILGIGDWEGGSSNMFRTAYQGLKYYSPGGTGFVDVRDVVLIMIKLMESTISKQRFIVCAENLKYQVVFDWMHDGFGKRKAYIKAGKILAGLVWRFEKVKALVTGKNPLITKETVHAAFTETQYSNKKVTTALAYQFIPIKSSIDTFCKIFLKQLEESK